MRDQIEFPKLNFKRAAKHPWVEEFNRELETCFLNTGIQYAKIYARDKNEFRRLFKERSFVRGCSVWIYWTYKMHGLVKEVVREEGESDERFAARKILEVFKTIIPD